MYQHLFYILLTSVNTSNETKLYKFVWGFAIFSEGTNWKPNIKDNKKISVLLETVRVSQIFDQNGINFFCFWEIVLLYAKKNMHGERQTTFIFLMQLSFVRSFFFFFLAFLLRFARGQNYHRNRDEETTAMKRFSSVHKFVKFHRLARRRDEGISTITTDRRWRKSAKRFVTTRWRKFLFVPPLSMVRYGTFLMWVTIFFGDHASKE